MKQILREIKQRIKDVGTKPADCQELDLSGIKLESLKPEVKELLEGCPQLESLIMTQCDLRSLQNLPNLPKLSTLDVSTNSLPDKEISNITKYSNLETLSIADNKVQKLETVKALAEHLTKLKHLECADNPIEKLPDYFKTIFKTFSKLVSLDSKDRQGKEILEEQEDFQESGDWQEGEEGEGEGQQAEGDQGGDDDEDFEEDGDFQEDDD